MSFENFVSDTPSKILWDNVADKTVAPHKKMGDGVDGECSLCGVEGKIYRVKNIVSGNFAGWDQYSNIDEEPYWCVSCVWNFTCADKVKPLLIKYGDNVDGNIIVDKEKIRQAMLHPLSSNWCIIVPVSRQKHVIPYAQWGKLNCDQGAFPWGVKESTIFSILNKLKLDGYRESSLNNDVPHLNKTSPDPKTYLQFLDDWAKIQQYKKHHADMWNVMIIMLRSVK